jgi:hypothetical protein
MGWLELRGWLAELRRSKERAAGRDRTDPDSWQGYESDGWWAEQRRKHDQMRGRG